jgi:hypothetical protein
VQQGVAGDVVEVQAYGDRRAGGDGCRGSGDGAELAVMKCHGVLADL